MTGPVLMPMPMRKGNWPRASRAAFSAREIRASAGPCAPRETRVEIGAEARLDGHDGVADELVDEALVLKTTPPSR